MIKKMYNKLIVSSLIGFGAVQNLMGVTTDPFLNLGKSAKNAANLVSMNNTNEGGIYFLFKAFVIFVGAIIVLLGINQAFLKDDSRGEGEKQKGVMKMIGGGLFIGVAGLIEFIQNLN